MEIYDCKVNDWSQLPGGASGPIQRYYPLAGSGTRAVFTTEILGKPAGFAPPTGVAGCPDTVFIEANNASAIRDEDRDTAIMAYSAAAWVFQETNRLNPTIDLRRDARIGGITTSGSPSFVALPVRRVVADEAYRLDTSEAGVVQERNVALVNPAPGFPGVRYVFNLLDNTGSRAGYLAARMLFGFHNAPGGLAQGARLCAPPSSGRPGEDASGYGREQILSTGFAPLAAATPDPTKNLAGSTCRKYP